VKQYRQSGAVSTQVVDGDGASEGIRIMAEKFWILLNC